MKKLSKEELETMSYDDIAYEILKSESKKQKLPILFKKICDLLELSEEEYESKISDFFQLISTDQRFTMLEDGFWDLKEKHQSKVVLDQEEDDEDLEDLESEDLTDVDSDEVNHEDDTYYDEESEDDDPTEDDLKDLVIISTDEEDEANANL